MKKVNSKIPKVVFRIIECGCALIVALIVICLIRQNLIHKPLKLESIEYIEKIRLVVETVADGGEVKELILTDKKEISDFAETVGDVKAKRIINGGGGDAEWTCYVEIYYSDDYTGDVVDYFRFYGEQILFGREAEGPAYRMLEDEEERLRNHFLSMSDR